jgi:hypothetical protein
MDTWGVRRLGHDSNRSVRCHRARDRPTLPAERRGRRLRRVRTARLKNVAPGRSHLSRVTKRSHGARRAPRRAAGNGWRVPQPAGATRSWRAPPTAPQCCVHRRGKRSDLSRIPASPATARSLPFTPSRRTTKNALFIGVLLVGPVPLISYRAEGIARRRDCAGAQPAARSGASLQVRLLQYAAAAR